MASVNYGIEIDVEINSQSPFVIVARYNWNDMRELFLRLEMYTLPVCLTTKHERIYGVLWVQTPPQ